MDVMLDLETFGIRPGAALRSVGLVTFALGRPAEGGETFYSNIDDVSCAECGLVVEQGTVDWWSKQSRESQEALLVNRKPLDDVVQAVEKFFDKNCVKCVWAQGANFDPILWEAACRAVGREAPWRFFNVRDTRTLYDAAGFDPRSIARVGTYHNALDDARHQVACLQAAWARILDPAHAASR